MKMGVTQGDTTVYNNVMNTTIHRCKIIVKLVANF